MKHPKTFSTAVVLAGLYASACSGGNHPAKQTARDAAVRDAASHVELGLRFDEQAASALNGELPSADAKTVCGADDRRFLAELLTGNPLDYKVPKRLADVKEAPSEVAVSGTIVRMTLGAKDFPFDHTFGSDFYADVALDPPYRGVGQEHGSAIDTVHVELASGQFPHRERAPASDEQPWPAMSERALAELQEGFVPAAGDRVLVMGNWVIDCGHVNFQTELHPITFLAVARAEGDATVVHTFYNPYRESQLYHPDPGKAVAFEDANRFADESVVPFPKMLFNALLRIQDMGPEPYPSAERLESWAMLEPNLTSPPAFRVCLGAGAGKPTIGTRFVTRPAVEIDATPDGDSGCATVRISLGSSTPERPSQHVCTTPWDFLAQAAADEASGDSGDADAGAAVDLKAALGAFVADAYRGRLDRDPAMNCYDPLAGADLAAERPSQRELSADPNALMPFFGTLVLRPSK